MNTNFQRTTRSNLFDRWSEELDLNQQPYAPKAYALPDCATFRWNRYLLLPRLFLPGKPLSILLRSVAGS